MSIDQDEFQTLEVPQFLGEPAAAEVIREELLVGDLPDASEASRSRWREHIATDAALEAVAAVAVPLVPVPDPRITPYRMAPFLRLLGGDGKWYTGSAFIIGPHHLATAGHNVFFHDVGGPTRVRVFPGRSGGTSIAALEASHFRASAAWRNDADETRDYGIIRVTEDLTDLEAFRMVDLPSDTARVNVAGYPSGDPAGRMWGAQARIDHVSVRRIGYPIATRKGQSGGPVWVANTRDVVAVHVRLDDFAIGIRLTPQVRADLAQLG